MSNPQIVALDQHSKKWSFHALKLSEVDSSEVAFFNLNDPAKFGRYTFLKKKRISTKLHNFIILDN